jgi:hypothetical protein
LAPERAVQYVESFNKKMKIGLFTEFSYPDKSEQQTYAEVLEQIALADELGYDFFSTTES